MKKKEAKQVVMSTERLRRLKVLQKQIKRGEEKAVAKRLLLIKEISKKVADAVPALANCKIWRNQLIEDIEKDDGSVILALPNIFVISRSKNIVTGNEQITIIWESRGEWNTVTINRSIFVQKRKLLEALSEKGVPVTERNIKEVMYFLQDFEVDNDSILDFLLETNHCGFLGEDGELGFMNGLEHLRPAGLSDTRQISLNPDSTEMGFLAEGLHREGTFEEWGRIASKAKHFPHVVLAILAALSGPLVSYLGASNIIFSLAHPTSTGKTVTLRLAASIFGQNRIGDPESIIRTCNVSLPFIHSYVSSLGNITAFLDDTKQLPDDKMAVTLVYEFSSGRSAGRGRSNGTARDSVTWATVLIITGENSLLVLPRKKHGGSESRVLEVMGAPFGPKCDETAELIQEIKDGIDVNYGHAGPKMIQYLLDHPEMREELQAEYREHRRNYAKKAGENSIAGRLGEGLAVFEIAAKLAHEVLGLDWDFRSAIDFLWEQVMVRTDTNALPRRALEAVYQYAERNQGKFLGRGTNGGKNLIGRWDMDDDWKFIAILPKVLRDILTKEGFEPTSIIDEWRESGVLITEGNRKDKKLSLGSDMGQVRVIVIRREALVKAGVADPIE